MRWMQWERRSTVPSVCISYLIGRHCALLFRDGQPQQALLSLPTCPDCGPVTADSPGNRFLSVSPRCEIQNDSPNHGNNVHRQGCHLPCRATLMLAAQLELHRSPLLACRACWTAPGCLPPCLLLRLAARQGFPAGHRGRLRSRVASRSGAARSPRHCQSRVEPGRGSSEQRPLVGICVGVPVSNPCDCSATAFGTRQMIAIRTVEFPVSTGNSQTPHAIAPPTRHPSTRPLMRLDSLRLQDASSGTVGEARDPTVPASWESSGKA
ncbi:hypothetical protein QBC47DRAFT_212505 [Echria macrotheca]|uniref:Uncharacterized protein n=1 Tax=Echria macrotheca TaxID=438768 RepID=A0AAJ0BBK4_9PEZI|nr:hypothetical protein QBC47DRAFT_212505 [Echria macrotheca]